MEDFRLRRSRRKIHEVTKEEIVKAALNATHTPYNKEALASAFAEEFCGVEFFGDMLYEELETFTAGWNHCMKHVIETEIK